MAMSPGTLPTTATVSYTDLNSLRNLNQADGNLDAVARQFESLFVDELLKSMRKATAALSPDSLFGSSELEMRQEMLDHQWAIHMSESGGLGLRQLIMSQLSGAPRASGEPRAFGAPRAYGEPRASTTEAPSAVESVAAPPMQRRSSIGYEAVAEQPLPSLQAGFVQDLLPKIEAALAGTPLVARTVLAQAALETGWGRHTIRLPNGQSSFNLFNIKGTDDLGKHATGTIRTTTDEFVDGKRASVAAIFRRYPNVEASIADYRDLILGSDRYAQAVAAAKDPAQYADALQEAGYATDPNYGQKLSRVEVSVAQWVRSARQQFAGAD